MGKIVTLGVENGPPEGKICVEDNFEQLTLNYGKPMYTIN